ncbi:MAG: T9SS type A sorting domain-containing protein, partial [Rhodothermales bacterium]
APDLEDLDATGNLKFSTDFRSVYSTLLIDWFGLEAGTVEGILGGRHDALPFIADPTSIGLGKDELPAEIRLEQNYPNPFNPQTVIAFAIDRPAHVRLEVFDVGGRLVRTLVEGSMPAGRHEVRFDAGRLSSGTYIYRIETPAGSKSGSMTLVR